MASKTRSGLVSYAGDSEISDSEDERGSTTPVHQAVFVTTNDLGIPRSEPRPVSSPPVLRKPIVQPAPTTLVDYGDEDQNDSKGDNSTLLVDLSSTDVSEVVDEPSESKDEMESTNSPFSAPVFLSSRDVTLPPEPAVRCSKSLQSKIISLLQKKTDSGIDLTSSLQQRKDLRNPSIYEKLVHFCNLDEFGTNYPEQLYDPKEWTEDSFYDNLFKEQRKEYVKKAKLERTTVEFVTGTKRPPATSGALKPDPVKKTRRSKWDVSSTNSGPESGGSRGASPSAGRDRPPLLGSAPIGMQPRILQTRVVGAQAKVQATQLSKELSKVQYNAMVDQTSLVQAITVLSLVVSVYKFLQTNEIPVLMVRSRSDLMPAENNECNNESCNCSVEMTGPYIAPGPSELQPLVPMSVLNKNVQLDSFKGLKHLDHTSLSRFYQCQSSDNIHLGDQVTRCSERSFRGPNSPLVALVSFHGSGNTWLRYLLEQATGYFSGSIYCDNTLKKVFPGECVASGNVVVIKTHHADTRTLPKDVQIGTGREKYDKAIVLVRNPYDALVSEANRRWNYNRSVNSHVGIADETSFISNSKWDGLVDYKGIVWAFLLHTWLSQEDTPVYVVQYERLKSDTEMELKRILAFLNISITAEKMECVMINAQGMFKREGHLNFDPYSKTNIEALNRHMRQALPLLAKYNITYELR